MNRKANGRLGRGFHVRQATPDDVDEMWALERAIARERVLWGEVPAPRDTVKARVGPLAFVAEANGRLVGHISGVVRGPRPYCVFKKGQRFVELDELYVRRGWRGRGVGSALVRRMLGAARKAGYRRFLVCTANKDLERAIRFYRGVGFRTWYANLFI